MKKRLNISLPADTEQAVKILAKRDHMPQSAKVLSLLETALEIEEDTLWNAIAAARDKTQDDYITHEEAWG